MDDKEKKYDEEMDEDGECDLEDIAYTILGICKEILDSIADADAYVNNLNDDELGVLVDDTEDAAQAMVNYLEGKLETEVKVEKEDSESSNIDEIAQKASKGEDVSGYFTESKCEKVLKYASLLKDGEREHGLRKVAMKEKKGGI